jgi:site-specific recombinase XerD
MTDVAGELAKSWRRSLVAAGKSPRTIEGYMTTRQQFTNWCQANGHPADPASQRRADVETFIGELLATRARGTAATRFRNLRAWFNWLAEEGEIPQSPMAQLRQPKVTAKVVPVLTDDELRRLLDTCRNDRTLPGRRDFAILRTLVDTGMRRGEVVALTLADVDLDVGVVIVRRSKTGTGRIVPLGAKATAAVDRWLRVRVRHPKAADTDLVWLGHRGPLTGEGIRQMVMKRANEAGLEGVFVHQLRHAFAHRWLAAGGQEHDLAQVAGWSNTAMLARYGSSAAAERARAAHARLGLGDKL